MNYPRREFIKTGLKGLCGLAIGAGIARTLQGCTPAKVIKTEEANGLVRIPLSSFAESNTAIIRTPGSEYDILAVKEAADRYSALLMKCTHRNFQLNANSRGLNCPLHGSSFDLHGNVTTGPATEPLQHFKTRIENDFLIIQIH